MVVVLPAPLGPSRVTTSPRLMSNLDPVENIVGAITHPQVVDLDHSVAATICHVCATFRTD